MKKILVPCDFSRPALNAFKFALDLAAIGKGSVHLLHIVELPVLHDSVLMPVLNFEEQLLKELRVKAQTEFEKMIARLNKKNINVTTTTEFGHPSREIAEYAKKNKVDMIVMGSHGASGFKEYFIGSNAEKIVRTSPVPVLVLKEYYKGTVKNIVFPVDIEIEVNADLVEKVKALQAFFKATLHVVRINTPINFTVDSESREKLNAFVKEAGFRNCTVNIYNHFTTEEGISAFAKSVKGNMIAMGTHGRKGLARFVAGSLTETVVNHAQPLVWSYVMHPETE